MDDKDSNIEFDKFMEQIIKEEASKKARSETSLEDSPSRVHQKRYKELPQNRIVFRR